MKNFVGIAVLLLLAGCGAAQIYEGERRDPSEVAVVHDDRGFYGLVNRNVHVVSIDGVERRRLAPKIGEIQGQAFYSRQSYLRRHDIRGEVFARIDVSCHPLSHPGLFPALLIERHFGAGS
jgi:hypothetical protein